MTLTELQLQEFKLTRFGQMTQENKDNALASDTLSFETAYKSGIVDERLHEIMADIRESALLHFFNRFSNKKIDGLGRKGRRQLERWLDKNNVKFQESAIGHDFIILIPTQTTALYCDINIDEETFEISYEFKIVNKHEVRNNEKCGF
jgi:hypothetical protein